MLLHASDLLDQRIIEQGKFTPSYSLGNVQETILEIVELVRMTVKVKKVTIFYNMDRSIPKLLSYDKRRLQ